MAGCENVKECPCPNVECERHKHCCACVLAHREKGNLPLCFAPAHNT
ncbi:MAG: hypothetical protein FWE24_11360 [Defluviitaleaceae bacterium]|nr:hypothetical protein [Defluviitaleaceae bacterium]